jgi:hypothetical protein
MRRDEYEGVFGPVDEMKEDVNEIIGSFEKNHQGHEFKNRSVNSGKSPVSALSNKSQKGIKMNLSKMISPRS